MKIPRPRPTAILADSFRQRLNLYALAATAGGIGMMALTQPAEAKIVYTPAHLHMNGYGTWDLDLNHDGVNDFFFRNTTEGGNTATQSLEFGVPLGASNKVRATRSAFESALYAGSPIGTRNQHFSAGLYMAKWYPFKGKYRGQWANNGNGVKKRYLGVSFQIKGKTHYGWARVNVTVHKSSQGAVFKALLTGYAYETVANKPIIAGKTKSKDVVTDQPASLGDLARGVTRR